jgi:hypothetical protein
VKSVQRRTRIDDAGEGSSCSDCSENAGGDEGSRRRCVKSDNRRRRVMI